MLFGRLSYDLKGFGAESPSQCGLHPSGNILDTKLGMRSPFGSGPYIHFFFFKSLGMMELSLSGHVCQCFSQRQRLLSPLQYLVPVGQSRHHSSPTLTFSLIRHLAKKNAKMCQGFKSTEKMTQLFQYTSMSTHIFPHTGVEQSTVRNTDPPHYPITST